NPMAYTMHSGRLVGIPFACLVIFWMREKLVPPTWVQILLGVGIVMTPFSNFLWLPVLWLIWSLLRQPLGAETSMPGRTVKENLQFMAGLCVLGLLVIPLYFIHPSRPTAWLNAFFGFLLFRSIWIHFRLGKIKHRLVFAWREWPLRPMAWTMLFSALFLGNL